MEKLLIRPYHTDDEEAVIDLWQVCNLVAPQNNPKRDIERKMRVHPEWFFVGILDDQIITTCMAGYDGHRGWINYLAVSPKYRHQGIATSMMIHAESLLKAAGCPKINLQIRESNSKVIPFYQSIGYRQEPVLSMGKRLENDEIDTTDADKS
jgi:ribosomal protein S18 acetylase RimI-like enzyme